MVFIYKQIRVSLDFKKYFFPKSLLLLEIEFQSIL